MKRALFILAAVCCMMSCTERNNPDTKRGDTTEQNQPANPSTWSPVGKRYMRDRSTNNAYGYTEFYEVVDFFKKDSAVWYGTIYKDLTPMENYYNPARYQLEYPNLTFTFGIDKDEYTFRDTLTLYCNTSEEGDYKLLDANNFR